MDVETQEVFPSQPKGGDLESLISNFHDENPLPVFCKNGHLGKWKQDGDWFRCVPSQDICSCKLSKKVFISRLGDLVKAAFLKHLNKQGNNEENEEKTCLEYNSESKEAIEEQITSTGWQLAALTFHQISSESIGNRGSTSKKKKEKSDAQKREIENGLAPECLHYGKELVHNGTQTETVQWTNTEMVQVGTNTEKVQPWTN